MPVIAVCPRCRAALMGTGLMEHCRRCGENVVAVRRALCANCGQDVSRALRVEHPPGEFNCHDCWTESMKAQGQSPVYPCGHCGSWLPARELYPQATGYVCKPCASARDFDPDALLNAAAEASGGEPLGFNPAVLTLTEVRRMRQQARLRRLMIWTIGVGAMVVVAMIVVLVITGK